MIKYAKFKLYENSMIFFLFSQVFSEHAFASRGTPVFQFNCRCHLNLAPIRSHSTQTYTKYTYMKAQVVICRIHVALKLSESVVLLTGLLQYSCFPRLFPSPSFPRKHSLSEKKTVLVLTWKVQRNLISYLYQLATACCSCQIRRSVISTPFHVNTESVLSSEALSSSTEGQDRKTRTVIRASFAYISEPTNLASLNRPK